MPSIEFVARTALALIVRMPELGSLTREQAAALLGVAPYVRESGRHQSERHVAGGRARPRKSLYAAAQAASLRWNRELVAHYDRLTKAGNPIASPSSPAPESSSSSPIQCSLEEPLGRPLDDSCFSHREKDALRAMVNDSLFP